MNSNNNCHLLGRGQLMKFEVVNLTQGLVLTQWSFISVDYSHPDFIWATNKKDIFKVGLSLIT